jgi:hypothetical protein
MNQQMPAEDQISARQLVVHQIAKQELALATTVQRAVSFDQRPNDVDPEILFLA